MHGFCLSEHHILSKMISTIGENGAHLEESGAHLEFPANLYVKKKKFHGTHIDLHYIFSHSISTNH